MSILTSRFDPTPSSAPPILAIGPPAPPMPWHDLHFASWLKAYIADPKSKMPDAKMPKLNLSADDLDAVVQYMLTLK